MQNSTERSNSNSNGSNSNEEVLHGTIQRVTYRNPDNGYSVIQIKVAHSRDIITVVGNAVEAKIGAYVVARGIYKEHPKFGRQLAANSITETLPNTTDGIERYLASGMIKGIGAETAKKIVKAFGTDSLEVIYQDANRLARIPGVGRHKAAIISKAFAQQREIREVMQFLVAHGVSPNLATRIFKQYEIKTIEILTHNPYTLARDLRGVGFLTADTIAQSLGHALDSPSRLKAGLVYTLEKGSDDGHCFLPTEVLCEKAKNLLKIESAESLPSLVETLLNEGILERYNDGIYLPQLLRAEESVSRFIVSRIRKRVSPLIDPIALEKTLLAAEQSLNIEFTEEQRNAVFDSTMHPMMIITGGPGCGKTTIIKALAHVAKRSDKKLILAAPTGRAAQRMSQVCEHPAGTIHRVLKFDPLSNRFVHGSDDPLDGDVVIIDEASMIDIKLAASLFQALPRHSTLILVGDKDQLPSVGPGRVFGDLVDSDRVKTVRLSRLFRRSETSSINTIAHLINAGQVPEIPQPDGVTKTDAYFLPQKDAESAAQTVERLMVDQITKKFDIAANDIVVLTPSNRGPLGTLALNERLQARLNGNTEVPSITFGSTVFRVGDRVCQRVNNYNIDEAGVFNGDSGTIYSVDTEKRSLIVELWDGRLINYDEGALGQLSLAYAVTVHRSQGSEIPCVVLCLHDSHYVLLERQLVYTAVTRAKKLLIVVGSKRALQLASKRTSTTERFTAIKNLIAEELEKVLFKT